MEDLEGQRLMRREEVLRICGISNSLLHEMIEAGTFPRPVRINERAVGWRVKDVLAWLASRPLATGTNWR
jgi:prophage regulatory protein